jgi:mono/diheme cytochrome c family protein
MPLRILVALCALVATPGVAVAQGQPQIKTVPTERVSAADGAQMFQSYCAACHGSGGRGDGPAVPALKKAPADLTTLSARNGGTFPAVKIGRYIEGSDEVAAHGTREMPMWGSVFRSLGPDTGIAALRVANLTEYLKSIQR